MCWIRAFFLCALSLILNGLMPMQSLRAQECDEDDDCVTYFPAHHLFVEPDLYHVKRTRDGGSYQKGVLHGVKLGYNRLKPWAVYWEVNSSLGQGKIKGKNGGGDSLVSYLKDVEIEGRIGYSLAFFPSICASFTPYVGYGYFKQTNKFVDPSPLSITFRDLFHYASAGFLSQVFLRPELSVGVNFEVKFMLDGKSKVSDDPDPEIDDLFLIIANQTHYEVEIPIIYYLWSGCQQVSVGLTPFYQLRQYGGHENYPFDFLRTRFNVYGGRLALGWEF